MTWTPLYPVRSDGTIKLQRDNPFQWTYTHPRNTAFEFGTTGYLTFKDSFGATVDVWEADADAGVLPFFADTDHTNAITQGTSWQLSIDVNDGETPRVFEQGTVVRQDNPFPSAPSVNPAFSAVQYAYSFGNTGFVVDPVWRKLNGKPRVYDNSLLSLPNAVAAGSLLGGDLAVFDDVCMLYYAPMMSDNVRVTYTTVSIAAGEAWFILCSNYDGTNYAAIRHKKSLLGDKISIAKGTGPVSLTDQVVVSHTTGHENFTASYNHSSKTFAVYLGTDTTPIVSWTDGAESVHHGVGDRYVGMGFKSNVLTPGVEFANWYSADAIGA